MLTRRQGIIAALTGITAALSRAGIVRGESMGTIVGSGTSLTISTPSIDFPLTAFKSYVFRLGDESITLSPQDLWDALNAKN